mmetsp:Transcript_12858/g.35635  ORF Transcript_12858/g.35635 Transcript_12858/m.35635 type:complete len:114 (+) Transcript_12858:275-616(+)
MRSTGTAIILSESSECEQCESNRKRSLTFGVEAPVSQFYFCWAQLGSYRRRIFGIFKNSKHNNPWKICLIQNLCLTIVTSSLLTFAAHCQVRNELWISGYDEVRWSSFGCENL